MNPEKKKTKRIVEDWSVVITASKSSAEHFYKNVGVFPTLRALFYHLVSKGTIPNTLQAYKALSDQLTRARKSGVFPWDYIRDEGRRSLGCDAGASLEALRGEVGTLPVRKLQDIISAFREFDSPNLGYEFRVKKWAGQPERVIVLVEKDAMLEAIDNAIQGYGVTVKAMKGYNSATNMKTLVDEIQYLQKRYTVHLLILVDFDASGADIARYVQDTLRDDFKVEVDCLRIAVTESQIQEFGLPSIPGTEAEKEKMRRDSRFPAFFEKYGYTRVELDAFLAFNPQEFKRLLRDAIKQFYDESIETTTKEEVRGLCRTTEEFMSQINKEFQGLTVELERIVKELVAKYGTQEVDEDDEDEEGDYDE